MIKILSKLFSTFEGPVFEGPVVITGLMNLNIWKKKHYTMYIKYMALVNTLSCELLLFVPEIQLYMVQLYLKE